MIDKITKVEVSIDGGSTYLDFTPGEGVMGVGADLSYGMKPSRAGWSKVGSYVNFGIESFVCTILPGVSGYESVYAIKPGSIVYVKLNDGDAVKMFVSNACMVTYPANVEVGVKFPQMKQYFRIDLMTQPE